MRLLVVSSRLPYPIQKGDKLRLYHQIKTLSKHFEVYLYSCAISDVKNDDINKLKKYCKEVFVHEIEKSDIITNIGSALLLGGPFQVALYSNPKIKKEISDIVSNFKIEHIYCQLIRMADNVADLKIPKTIDFMDAFGYGMEQRGKSGSFFKKLIYNIESTRVKKYEKKIYDQFDNHLIITDQDRNRLELGDKKVHVIQNGVDSDFFTHKTSANDYDLVFVGNMGYLPNVVAAKYLAKEILPILNEKTNKKYSLFIAGARPTNEVINLTEDENVVVAGWLEDIRSAYQVGRIFVAPIFSGIGQQNKILEAMSMKIPVVLNQSVAEGIGMIHEKNCLIANTPNEFVDAIIRIENDNSLREKITNNGRVLVEEKFNWESQNIQLVKLIMAAT